MLKQSQIKWPLLKVVTNWVQLDLNRKPLGWHADVLPLVLQPDCGEYDTDRQ